MHQSAKLLAIVVKLTKLIISKNHKTAYERYFSSKKIGNSETDMFLEKINQSIDTIISQTTVWDRYRLLLDRDGNCLDSQASFPN